MTSAPDFPEQPTLPQLQAHVRAICDHLGFTSNTAEREFLLFVEEVGELAKAMRRAMKFRIESGNPDKPMISDAEAQQNITEEFGDVLAYLMELANRFGVDLESAYRDKMAAALKRTWS